MTNREQVPVGKYATLVLVLGAHVLVMHFLLRAGHRATPAYKVEPRGILYFVELPRPSSEKTSEEPELSMRPATPEMPSDAASAITLPSELPPNEADIDWHAEQVQVARDWGKREAGTKDENAMGSTPKGMKAPPKSQRPKRGDVQRFEGGVVIEWVNDRCYYTNEAPPGVLIGQKYAPVRVCKDAPNRYQDFETWQKERERLRSEGEDLP